MIPAAQESRKQTLLEDLLTAGSVEYSYDFDGFLTTKTDGTDVTTYRYSSRGELLSVNLPDGKVIEYVHDPLGRRTAKKIDGVIVEKYLWQGITRLLAVYDGSDNLLMRFERFEYADDRMPVAVATGGETYYLTYDQVGSLRVVADSAGVVVKRIDYDSFGNIIADTDETFKVPLGFAGGLHDRDTGLVRFGFRDYDADVGRWTAKDPIFFEGGDTDLYGYVLNDPVNLIDPKGLFLKAVLSAFGQVANVFLAGGEGALIGGIAGGVIGGAFYGVPGFIVGAVGGTLFGSMFDPAHAGKLNYGHDEVFRNELEMAEAERLLREYKEIREQLEEWNYHTGGSLNDNHCK
jgi:RHS repeat-associated protein